MTQTRLAVIALMLPGLVGGQNPPKRAHHAMIYDETAERVLVTGGSTPFDNGNCCTFFNDLWSWDGTRWTALPPSGNTMSGMRLAWDPRTKKVLSFGGYMNGRSWGEVRSLDANAWKLVGNHAEMAAAEPGFVFDTRRNRFYAFGGSAGRGQAHGDSWEYDGTTWTRVGGAGPLPPPRQAHAMVYDERRGRTVVFGGMGTGAPGQPPPMLGDLWEFDGATWSQKQAANGPSARGSAGVTYDSKRGLVILFGGMGANGMLGDTWSWNGTEWKKLADAGPDARAMGYLAYDKKRDRVVLFGGRKGWPNDLDDTWEWDGASWRRVAP